MIKPKITKPWSKEMYEWNDIVAGLMKAKIRESIEKNKDNWNILNELIVLCGGIKYGDGISYEDLYEGCLDELDSVMNYWLKEEFPYAVKNGLVEPVMYEFVGY